MRFFAHTETDVRAMLDTIGARGLDDLIAHVPAGLRESATIDLAPGKNEAEIAAERLGDFVRVSVEDEEIAIVLGPYLDLGMITRVEPAVVVDPEPDRGVAARRTPNVGLGTSEE